MIPRRQFFQFMAGGAIAPLAAGAAPGRSQDWRHYGGDQGASRYSSLAQIDTTNVRHLQLAWRYETGIRLGFEASPVVVDKVDVSCGKSPVATVSRREWPGWITAVVGKISTSSATGVPGVRGTCESRV